MLQVSGVTGMGVDQVLYGVIATLDAEKAAKLEAARKNQERIVGQLRGKRVAPSAFVVCVLYPRRKADAVCTKNVWRLSRRTQLHAMDADDVLAFAVEDAMMR